MPKGRSALYAIFKACTLFGIAPPGVKKTSWDDNNVVAKAEMLAFSQIREVEHVGCPLIGGK
jgi:hypothetical protein